MKSVLPRLMLLALAFVFCGCDTIENRRSLYAPKKADGPYTRALEDGTWDDVKSAEEQYAEEQRLKKGPQMKKQPATTAPGGEAR